MYSIQQRPITLIIVFLILALGAGFAAAHDTGEPHTHEPVDELGKNSAIIPQSQTAIPGSADDIFTPLPETRPPLVIIVVSAHGKLYYQQWLVHHLLSVLTAAEDAAPSAASHPHQYPNSHAHSHSHLHAHAGSHAHEHPQTGAPTEPQARWHNHRHAQAHEHICGMSPAYQHHPPIQDETKPSYSSTRIN